MADDDQTRTRMTLWHDIADGLLRQQQIDEHKESVPCQDPSIPDTVRDVMNYAHSAARLGFAGGGKE